MCQPLSQPSHTSMPSCCRLQHCWHLMVLRQRSSGCCCRGSTTRHSVLLPLITRPQRSQAASKWRMKSCSATGLLATAGDDGTVLIWKCTATNSTGGVGDKKVAFGQDPAAADAELETWTAVSALMCVHILV